MTDATGDPVNLGEAPLNLPRTSGDESTVGKLLVSGRIPVIGEIVEECAGRFPSRPIRPRGLWSGGNSSFSCEGFFDPVEQIRFHAPIRQQYSVSGLRGVRVCIPRSDLGRDAYTRLLLAISNYLDRTLKVTTREAIPLFVRMVNKSVKDRQAAVHGGMKFLDHFLDFHLRMMKYTPPPHDLDRGLGLRGTAGQSTKPRRQGAR